VVQPRDPRHAPTRGLVHEFALSYAASFVSEPDRIVSCEHGNQFDPANARRDHADPLETPLGDHIVTDLEPRIPAGRTVTALHLGEVERVFPLTLIPEWLAGRLYYDCLARSVRWLVLPLLVLFAGSQLIAYAGGGKGGLDELLVQVLYDVLSVLVLFVLLVLVLRWTAMPAIQSATTRFSSRDPADEHADAAVAESESGWRRETRLRWPTISGARSRCSSPGTRTRRQ